MNYTKTTFKKIFKTLFIFSFTVFFLACSSTDKISTDADFIPNEINWEKVDDNENVEYFSYSNAGIKYHCVKIDLNQEKLEILAHPKAEQNSEKTKNQKLQTLRSKKFVKLTNAKVAINTTPYMKDGKILGVHISDGEKISSEIKRYSALYFEKSSEGGYTAKITENQKEEDFTNASAAFGGFFTILKDGEIQSFKHTSYDARTAAGISSNKTTLYLLSVEKGIFGRGLSYPECAELLKFLGSSDALEFDGGNSTSIFVSGKVIREESFRKNSAYLGFNF